MSERLEAPKRMSVVWLGVLAVLVAGAALRLAFLWVSHPHVDEYSSTWAALQVLRQGIPQLPSGFMYLQGLLFTYVDALFIGALGLSEMTARLPSLLASIVTLVLIYAWGRRAFGPWAGLIAASLTALQPDSIIWGGRARMYALQQMCVVLALYAFCRGYIEGAAEPRGARWRWTFAVSFVAAILSQTVTALIAPAVVIALLVWRSRWLGRPMAWSPLILAAFSLPVAAVLNRLGGPVSDPIGRDFVDPSLPWRLKPEFFFREFFWAWPNMVATAVWVAGFFLLVVMVWRLKRSGSGHLRGENDRSFSTLLFLYLAISASFLPMLFLVGESWQRPRYLIMILPIIALTVAGVMWYMGGALSQRVSRKSQDILGLVVWLALLVLFLPPAWATIGPAEPAYDQAFHYVQAQWKDGDQIIGPLPSIGGVYLGRFDGYALQNGYEEYLVDKDGQRVDRWMGAPLIDSIAALERLSKSGRRMWFVVDDLRWAERYDDDFRAYVTQHMPTVYQAPGVTVFQQSGTAPVGPAE